MKRRIKHLLGFVVTGLILGLSSVSLFAAEPAKTTQRNIAVLVAQLSIDGETSIIPGDFNITDVLIDGNRLTLHGKRENDSEPVSVTLNIAALPKRAAVATPVRDRFNHDDIFNRDDDH